MKTIHLLFLLAAIGALRAPLGGAQAPPASMAPPQLSSRFKQVRERIDELFRNRSETPAPPDPRTNPFRSPGSFASRPSSVLPDTPGVPLPQVSGSDLTRLQESVATLKVSGTFEKDGRLYLVINAKPYKNNDVITTQVRGEPVYLRVRQISGRGVTLTLDEAEITLKF